MMIFIIIVMVLYLFIGIIIATINAHATVKDMNNPSQEEVDEAWKVAFFWPLFLLVISAIGLGKFIYILGQVFTRSKKNGDTKST